MKVLSITLVLLLILLTSSYLESTMAAPGDFCDGKCKVRCSRARNRCYKFCYLCCQECKCVPSGFFGNKDECPCYRDKVTSGPIKKPKCP